MVIKNMVIGVGLLFSCAVHAGQREKPLNPKPNVIKYHGVSKNKGKTVRHKVEVPAYEGIPKKNRGSLGDLKSQRDFSRLMKTGDFGDLSISIPRSSSSGSAERTGNNSPKNGILPSNSLSSAVSSLCRESIIVDSPCPSPVAGVVQDAFRLDGEEIVARRKYKRAFYSDDRETMIALFEQGLHPDSIRCGDDRLTPLAKAYARGNVDKANFLRAYGAQPTLQSRSGKTPIMYALAGLVTCEDLEQSEATIHPSKGMSCSLLTEAASSRRSDVVEWLIDTKRINVHAPLTQLTYRGTDGGLRYVTQGTQALVLAVKNGSLRATKKLLDAGVSKNAPNGAGVSAMRELEEARPLLAAVGALGDMESLLRSARS